jgi:hypothetical protein
MQPADMQQFVEISMKFFEKFTGERPVVADGQVQFGHSTLLEHCGQIRISGSSRGVVCLSMSSPMVTEMLASSGESIQDEDAKLDLIGEAASIIASNAREHFGSGFAISLPETRFHASTAADWPYSRFVLPIRWRSHEAVLVLALTRSSPAV